MTATILRSSATGLLAVAALSFICNLGTLAVPLFNMQIFNRVLPTRDLATLGALGIGLGICLIAWIALEWLRSIALDLLAAQVTGRLSPALIEAAAAAPKPEQASLQALSDIETIRSFVAGRACMAPFDIAWSPLLLIALLAMHWALGLLGLACVAVLALMNVLGDVLSRSAMLTANEANAASMRSVADGVNAAEAVVGLGMLPRLVARWSGSQADVGHLVHRALLRARAVSAANAALRAAMTGAMVALGLYLALNGMASSGAMVGGNMVLARLLMPFGSLAGTRREWADALAAWRRVRRLLDETSPRRSLAVMPEPAARLVAENLSYVAPGGDRALLRGISFETEPGETIAVIGPSSAGKSTLLRALLGMMPPTSGGAYLDGSSTYQWEREDFARHVGYVPQRPALLDETVACNIARLGVPDPAAVVAAAKRVGLHAVLAALPHGYATKLTPQMLSGGQRQRLALARALYARPKILILDEPSAFLDAAGEADLIRCLGQLKREGMTIILATHRPALLQTADRVIVLQDGMITKIGPAPDIREEVTPRIRLVNAEALAAS